VAGFRTGRAATDSILPDPNPAFSFLSCRPIFPLNAALTYFRDLYVQDSILAANPFMLSSR
jgi:hypothetical protein